MKADEWRGDSIAIAIEGRLFVEIPTVIARMKADHGHRMKYLLFQGEYLRTLGSLWRRILK